MMDDQKEKTQIPELMVEHFEDVMKSLLEFSLAMQAFSKAHVAFVKDLGQLAKVVAEIKENKRLKVREGK
jgi:hypothetical protein